MSARHGLLIGAVLVAGIGAVAVIGNQTRTTPQPQPSPSPTVRTVPVALPNCEDGTRRAGITCVTFDEGMYTLSNDKINMPLPVNPTPIGDRFMVTMPACPTEDSNNCVWTGAPDGHPGKGQAYIDIKGRVFKLTQKQLFG